MADVLILLAHPQLQHSRMNRAMIDSVSALPSVRVHDLYELYPDFFIDMQREKQSLSQARTIILQHPMQWYSCPSLLKEWIDVVLQKEWAYGENGTALQGKRWLHALTTGGNEAAYQPTGRNRYTIHELMRPFEQTAHLCGMQWQEPLVFHDALAATDAQIASHVARYQALIARFVAEA